MKDLKGEFKDRDCQNKIGQKQKGGKTYYATTNQEKLEQIIDKMDFRTRNTISETLYEKIKNNK